MNMFVRVDENGEVMAVSRTALDAGWQERADDDPAVVSFLARSQGPGADPFARSDAELVRVLEDLIQVLVERNVIRFTDLPPPAQAKLSRRQGMRDRMRRLSLLDEDGSDVI